VTFNGDTQDEPIQDQHPRTEDDQLAGILIQEEADLAGHDEAQVLAALRQRLADGGHSIPEDELLEHARRIAGLDPNAFSQK